MKGSSLFAILAILLTAARLGNAQTLDDITFYTEEFPPLNFTQDGKLVGIATEILEHAFKKHNTRKGVKDIIITDWNTAYNTVLKGPNKGIFAMSRTPVREDLFKWVGPITASTVNVFARKDRDFKITYDGEVKNFRVAVVKNDIGHVQAKRLGVPEQNIIARRSVAENFADLEAGRADIWIYGGLPGKFLLKNAQLTDKYEDTLTVFRTGQFIGFSLDVDDRIVEQLQDVLDEMKEEGLLDKIINRYIN
ncbi:MAG: transporter substrate-binding domain-containing protein [Alphaproteobacteria bacterium]|nr:transporter substrate-binding domain-containing protein [Alphaproteobacteria bacterium]